MHRLVVLALCLLSASTRPVAAQRAVEWQVHSVGVLTGSEFVGGGLGLAWRSDGRVRVGAALAGGSTEGAAAFRGEATISYHVNPFRRRGVAPYLAGGAAVTVTETASIEYVLVTLGLEARPGRAAGWFIETGVAGGLRVAAGIRLRRRLGR